MPITDRIAIDKIEILENGVFQIRRARIILDNDGTEINRTYIRSVLEPGDDLTNVPQRIKAHCNIEWTPQVIAAYQAAKALRNL